MKKLVIMAMLLIVPAAFAQEKTKKLNPGMYAVFETSMGSFTCELLQLKAPETVKSFVGLAEGTKEYKNPKTGQPGNGKPYYDGIIFHRVVDGFMIQSGDPSGTGTGGPGFNIPDENPAGYSFNKEGMLAMANIGRKNSGGAQFFITLGSVPLEAKDYSIFGQVVDGMDIVKLIGKVPTKVGPSGEKSTPVTPVVLKKVTIQRIK